MPRYYRGGWKDLSREHVLTTRTKGYWKIPDYAKKHEFKQSGFMNIFRRLRETAEELFPEELRLSPTRSVGIGVPISEDRKAAIRKRFLEDGDFRMVADEFGIQPFRVGQLCREEKKKRDEEREKSESAVAPTTKPEIGSPDFENVLF